MVEPVALSIDSRPALRVPRYFGYKEAPNMHIVHDLHTILLHRPGLDHNELRGCHGRTEGGLAEAIGHVRREVPQ